MIIIFVVIYLIYRICCYVRRKNLDTLKESLYFILFLYFFIIAQVTIFKYGSLFEWPGNGVEIMSQSI